MQSTHAITTYKPTSYGKRIFTKLNLYKPVEISLFWNLIFIASVSQGMFLVLVLFVQYFRTKHASQLFLALFILVFTLNLLNNLVYWNQMFAQFPHFLFSFVGIRFLFAPLFLWYCITFIRKRINKWHVLHFLPSFLLVIIYLPQISLSGAEKIELIQSSSFYIQFATWRKFIARNLNWALCIQLIVYAVLIFYLLKSHLTKNKNNINTEKSNQLNWLLFFNSLFFLYGIVTLLYWVLVVNKIGGVSKDYPISLVMCLIIYGISYFSVINPDLLKGEKYLQKIGILKYSKTQLSEEYLKNTIHLFEKLVTQDELFLDPDLKLDDVANFLSLKKHHISQALSLVLGKTFNEYVNRLRVNRAQILLDNLPKDGSIKAVMYSSGFNNRVSFNNNFKKLIGMTASEYLKTR